MAKEDQELNHEEFENPIDPDKVAENPGLLEYAHHVGSGIIKPEDKGKIKGRAVSAMHEQTNVQMQQLYDQMKLLAQQAQEIKARVAISERIYLAEMRFEPLISSTYYLYTKKGKDILTMVSPQEWGKSHPYEAYVAKVKLLSDHTWEILEKGDGFE
ncbi:MAG: DUF2452 domain-containing protein [Bacteroidetes bacterium]|nr:DUF2452 domain-containing protein [Bacteroidota bacterium]